jgi:hypothetical protein
MGGLKRIAGRAGPDLTLCVVCGVLGALRLKVRVYGGP